MYPKIIDCTLREGQQAAGVYFSRDQRQQIIAALGAFGVDEIEIGPAAPDSEMAQIAADIRTFAPRSRCAVWCRCLERDIRMAVDDGGDAVSISLPVSDLHLEKRLKKSRAWAIERVALAADAARSAGRPVSLSLGLEDASRADAGFVFEIALAAERAGFDRVRLADTVGSLTPLATTRVFSELRAATTLSLAIHAHNDFGMATANSVSALEAGAEWADASVLGLGERAGIARLEELGGYLAIRRGDTEYDVRLLAPLVEFVARITNTAVSDRHPIVGAKLFHCESGIHLDGLAKSEETYQPFAPSILGLKWTSSVGMKAGESAMRNALSSMDVAFEPACLREVTLRMREFSRQQRRALTNAEIATIVEDVMRARQTAGGAHGTA